MGTTKNSESKRVNPYMGIYTYTEYDEMYFWGRNEESSELTDIILNTTSTILAGYSGCGKSSLINAGITPRLKEYNFITIKITPKEVFNLDNRNNYASKFWELINERINDKLKEYEDDIVCIKKNNIDSKYECAVYDNISLWDKLFLRIFKKRGLKLYFLIVLDQFEELFQLDLNIKEINRVFKIYEIMSNSYSPYYEYIEEISQGSEKLFPTKEIYDKYSNEKTLHRFLISLRKEFLYDLESYSGHYPVLAHNIYYLENLDDDQARDIMMACDDFKPKGLFEGLNSYELIKTILNNKEDFDDTDKKTDYRIDTMTLSVVLYKVWENCYNKSINAETAEIRTDLFQKEVININDKISELFTNILSDFYNDRIKSLKQGSDKRNKEKKDYIAKILENRTELNIIKENLQTIFNKFINNCNDNCSYDDESIGLYLDSVLYHEKMESYADLIKYIRSSVNKDTYTWENTKLGKLITNNTKSNTNHLKQHIDNLFNSSNDAQQEQAAIHISNYAYGKLNDNELDDRGSNTKSIRQVLINNLKGFSLIDSINKCANDTVRGKLLLNLNQAIYELQDKLLSDSGLYRQSAYLDDLCKLFDKAIYGDIDLKKKKEWFCNIIKKGIIDTRNGLYEICGINNDYLSNLKKDIACDIIKTITLTKNSIKSKGEFNKEEEILFSTNIIDDKKLCELINNKCTKVKVYQNNLLCELGNRSIQFLDIQIKDIVCHLIKHDILKPKLINNQSKGIEEKNILRKELNKYVYRNKSHTANNVRTEIGNVIKNCKLFTELNKGNNENMLEFRHDRLCEMAKTNMDNYKISQNNAKRYTPNIYFTLQGRLKETNCFVDSIFGPWNTYSSIMSTMNFMEGDKNSIVDFSTDSIHQLKKINYDKASSAIVTIALNDRFKMKTMMDEYEDYHDLPAYFTHFRVKIENDKIYNISFETRENHDSNIQKVVIPTGFHKVRFYFDDYDRIVLKEFCVRKEEHKDFYTPPENSNQELPNDVRVTLPESGYNAIYYKYDTVDNQYPKKTYFLNISHNDVNDLREKALNINNIKSFLKDLDKEISDNTSKFIIRHIVDGNYGYESEHDHLGREKSRKFLGGTKYQFNEISIEYYDDDQNNKHSNDIKSISLYKYNKENGNKEQTTYHYPNKDEEKSDSGVHKIEFIYDTNGNGKIQRTKYYNVDNEPCIDNVKGIAGEQYTYFDNDNEHYVQTEFLDKTDHKTKDSNGVTHIILTKNKEGNRVKSIEAFDGKNKINGREINGMMYHKIEFKHYRDKFKTYLLNANGERYIIQNNGKVKQLKDPTETKEIHINNEVSFNMKLVKQGSFYMGNKDSKRIQEKPAHEVTLNDYYMGETTVTNKIWNSIMRQNAKEKANADCPKVRVSWDDVQAFIQKLNETLNVDEQDEKLTFRLPTEAEWEFAARGGNKSKEDYTYSGSNTLEDVAIIDMKKYRAYVVGRLQANELGIYDMSGNVKEWCEDYFGLYTIKEEDNPMGPRVGYSRVLRGGSFRSHYQTCSVYQRDCAFPDTMDDNIGFRLVLEIDN